MNRISLLALPALVALAGCGVARMAVPPELATSPRMGVEGRE